MYYDALSQKTIGEIKLLKVTSTCDIISDKQARTQYDKKIVNSFSLAE